MLVWFIGQKKTYSETVMTCDLNSMWQTVFKGISCLSCNTHQKSHLASYIRTQHFYTATLCSSCSCICISSHLCTKPLFLSKHSRWLNPDFMRSINKQASVWCRVEAGGRRVGLSSAVNCSAKRLVLFRSVELGPTPVEQQRQSERLDSSQLISACERSSACF